MIGTNFLNIACKNLKTAQIAQVNQLLLTFELRFAYKGTLRPKRVPILQASGIPDVVNLYQSSMNIDLRYRSIEIDKEKSCNFD